MALAITSAPAPVLAVVDGIPTTTSVDIARHFGKQHRNVVRDIENLIAQLPPGGVLNFEHTPLVNEQNGETYSAYRITRDGFTLLAMGFTGKKALAFKLAYIDAFNRMEQGLRAAPLAHTTSALDYSRISPAQAQDLKELVRGIAERKLQTYGETWARLHRKFQVNSYLELPAAKFDEARDYLLAKLPGSFQPLSDADRLALAFSVAAEAGASVQRSVFTQLAAGTHANLVDARVLAAVAYDRDGKPTVPWARALANSEFISAPEKFAQQIADHSVRITDVQASRIIAACAQVLTERAAQRVDQKAIQ